MPLSSTYQNPYVVAQAPVDERAAFIRRTYAHLAGAIAVFALLETALMSIPGIEQTVFNLLGTSRFSWLIVLGAFMGVSWLADNWARSETSIGKQYMGLGIYTVAEAIIFLPLLLAARQMTGDASLIGQAGLLTGALFLGLTAIALTAAFLIALRDKPGPERRATGLFALWLILTLFGPLGWQHYYLLPLLLLPGLIARMTPRAGLLLGIAVGLPSVRLVFLTIGFLPWPVANYVWLACPGWLAVLLTLHVRTRRNA